MNRPSARGVASALVSVLALVVVAAFVVQAVPAAVGADASYVVLSGSMEPTISPGDAVVVNDVDPADVETGDVITFVRPGESTPVTHRVVGVLDRENGLAFRTRGDANDGPDPQPVPAENVTGEVWFVIPFLGHVVLFANTPTGLAALVGLPVVAFVVSEVYAFATRGDETDGEATAGGEAAADEAAGDEGVAEPTADAVEARSADAADDAEAVTITSADLRLSSAAVAALAAYSGYVASQRPTPVHFAVLAAAVTVLGLVAAVLLFGEQASADADADRAARNAATDGGATEGGPRGGEES